ncbi:MAG: phosphomannomutase, partial [bacterium]|nr:phosphomannomutase [bacterium]
MNPLIFREYDIRGIVNVDLTNEDVRKIGQAYGTFAKRRGAKKVALGRDGRNSGPGFEPIVADGIRSTGVSVIRLGMVPTPVMYHYTKTGNVDGGLQITGSHNPPNYNGFKGMVGDETLHGELIQELLRIIQENDFEHGAGNEEFIEPIPSYLDDLAGKLKISRSCRIVVDAGNGVGGMTAVPLP